MPLIARDGENEVRRILTVAGATSAGLLLLTSAGASAGTTAPHRLSSKIISTTDEDVGMRRPPSPFPFSLLARLPTIKQGPLA
jgi:hypothetical protein